ncbi:MAG: hypothetical protein FWG11_03270 [Promicromonosporaceae bacterium]|nr:hypothetical protein [Promicromonosporaceae bacterium]
MPRLQTSRYTVAGCPSRLVALALTALFALSGFAAGLPAAPITPPAGRSMMAIYDVTLRADDTFDFQQQFVVDRSMAGEIGFDADVFGDDFTHMIEWLEDDLEWAGAGNISVTQLDLADHVGFVMSATGIPLEELEWFVFDVTAERDGDEFVVGGAMDMTWGDLDAWEAEDLAMAQTMWLAVNVTFPGPVSQANGTRAGSHTVTWVPVAGEVNEFSARGGATPSGTAEAGLGASLGGLVGDLPAGGGADTGNGAGQQAGTQPGSSTPPAGTQQMINIAIVFHDDETFDLRYRLAMTDEALEMVGLHSDELLSWRDDGPVHPFTFGDLTGSAIHRQRLPLGELWRYLPGLQVIREDDGFRVLGRPAFGIEHPELLLMTDGGEPVPNPEMPTWILLDLTLPGEVEETNGFASPPDPHGNTTISWWPEAVTRTEIIALSAGMSAAAGEEALALPPSPEPIEADDAAEAPIAAEEAGGLPPVAWVGIGAASGAALVGLAVLLPRTLRRKRPADALLGDGAIGAELLGEERDT